jgi:hypothetical protein
MMAKTKFVQLLKCWERNLNRGLFLGICLFVPLSVGGTRSNGTNSNEVTVRIEAVKTRILQGETLILRVEVCNEGREAVFVARNISDHLSLFIQHGPELQSSMLRSAKDFAHSSNKSSEPFANLLAKYWLPLGPGSFYGQRIEMNSDSYPQLRIPGRYLIKAQYISGGLFVGGLNDPFSDRKEEISQLPFPAWIGDIQAIPIWIEVTAPTRQKE